MKSIERQQELVRHYSKLENSIAQLKKERASNEIALDALIAAENPIAAAQQMAVADLTIGILSQAMRRVEVLKKEK